MIIIIGLLKLFSCLQKKKKKEKRSEKKEDRLRH